MKKNLSYTAFQRLTRNCPSWKTKSTNHTSFYNFHYLKAPLPLTQISKKKINNMHRKNQYSRTCSIMRNKALRALVTGTTHSRMNCSYFKNYWCRVLPLPCWRGRGKFVFAMSPYHNYLQIFTNSFNQLVTDKFETVLAELNWI